MVPYALSAQYHEHLKRHIGPPACIHMMSWADLPRDLQLRVIKHLDTDTPIKLGLVQRLRVPKPLQEKLSAVFGRIVHGRTKYCSGYFEAYSSELDLGSRNRFPWAPIYVLTYTPPLKSFTRRWAKWQVEHYVDDKGYSHSLDTAKNRWPPVVRPPRDLRFSIALQRPSQCTRA